MARLNILAACLAFLGATIAAAANAPLIKDTPRFNYQLHCSGCHKQDGSGQGKFVPNFRDEVSQFLHSDEGRQFLIRVPGVSQSELNDRQIADLMNWLVREFDPDHLPDSFTPYSTSEIAVLRQTPISDAGRTRTRIMSRFGSNQNLQKD